MNVHDIQELRRNVVLVLANLGYVAECQPPCLASKNVSYHTERLLESMDQLFIGRDELSDADGGAV
jgi:hypothetical protein